MKAYTLLSREIMLLNCRERIRETTATHTVQTLSATLKNRSVGLGLIKP